MVFQGSKRFSNISSLCQDSRIPNKQALWMEKKKKKLERKKKLSQRNKNRYNQQPTEFVENEIFLISSFLELSNAFFKRFFKNNWKVVLMKLDTNAFSAFEKCLQMISDCLHWFQNLIMSKEIKKDFVSCKKRLEFANNVLEILSDLFDVLQQYTHRYSIIKSMIPFDHRLYFDSNRCIRLPLATCDQVVDECVDEGTYFTKMLIFDAGLSGKATHLLDITINRKFMNRCEWKLKLKCGRLPWKQRGTSVRLINNQRVFELVLDNMSKSADLNTSHNEALKIVDDFQIWSEWQWKFLDGWMFSCDYLYYNLNWLNKFNVNSLEYFTSFTRIIFFLNNWILYSTEAVFSNKRCRPQCQLLWNTNCFDLMTTKTASLRILLKEGKGWYYGVMWISKEPCKPCEPFCENFCCIDWDSNDIRDHGIVQESVSQCESFQTKSSSSLESRLIRHKVKIQRGTGTLNSKTSDKLSNNKQTVLNKIPDDKINLSEEKQQSICILQ